jgi:hypothetical protein
MLSIDAEDEITLQQENGYLMELNSKYQTTLNEHLGVIEPEAVKERTELTKEFGCLYKKTIILFKQLLKAKRPTGTVERKPSFVRLPEIKLPTFDGNYNDWIYFREKFSNLVCSNNTLKKIALSVILYGC